MPCTNRSQTSSLAQSVRVSAPAALASLAPWVIRPRALTLTLWARLLACDLFVHGIGGAKYDRITDGLIRGYYSCEPPGFAAVTATLRLPLPRQPVSAADLARAEHERRDIHYNPQRYLRAAPAELLRERARLIDESQRLRAASGRRQGGPAGLEVLRLERRRVFVAIRELNERLLSSEPGLEDRMDQSVRQIERQVASNAVADSREFFYALQPRDRLEMLVERLTAG